MNPTIIKVDITVVISIIIAVVGLLAPSISSLIESSLKIRYEKKKNKQQLNKELISHRIDVLEHFLSYTGMILNWNDQETTKNYGSYCYKVIPYLPNETYDSFLDLIKMIDYGNYDEAKEIFVKISSSIRAYIETLNNKLK